LWQESPDDNNRSMLFFVCSASDSPTLTANLLKFPSVSPIRIGRNAQLHEERDKFCRQKWLKCFSYFWVH
jgi:hypothetical protein